MFGLLIVCGRVQGVWVGVREEMKKGEEEDDGYENERGVMR
jgi:hypothetical protein